MGAKRDVLMAYVAAWQQDWVAACRTYMAEDFVCIEPPELPQGGTFIGWDSPIRISNIYRAIWNVDVLDHQYFDADAGGVVVSRYLMRWTSRQTGRMMTEPVVELNHIDGNRITRMEVFHFDAAGLLATLDGTPVL